MEKVIFLTRENCVQCNAAKIFLKLAMGDKHKDNIEIVQEEENKERFDLVAAKYNVKTLPAFIFKEEIVLGAKPTEIKNLLESNFGRK